MVQLIFDSRNLTWASPRPQTTLTLLSDNDNECTRFHERISENKDINLLRLLSLLAVNDAILI